MQWTSVIYEAKSNQYFGIKGAKMNTLNAVPANIPDENEAPTHLRLGLRKYLFRLTQWLFFSSCEEENIVSADEIKHLFIVWWSI